MEDISSLIEKLRSGTMSERIDAAHALGEGGQEARAAVPYLIEALEQNKKEWWEQGSRITPYITSIKDAFAAASELQVFAELDQSLTQALEKITGGQREATKAPPLRKDEIMTRNPERMAPKGKIRVIVESYLTASSEGEPRCGLVGDYDSLDEAWRSVREKSQYTDAVPEMPEVSLHYIVYNDEGKVFPWPGAAAVEDTLEIVDRSARDAVEAPELEPANLPPVIKLVNCILVDAFRKRASAIHFELHEKRFVVRYRIDGVLHDALELPTSIRASITARLKIMAWLDITERRLPQNGHVSVKFSGKEIDLELSSAPTRFGEKIVVRVLDKSGVLLDLAELGFEKEDLQRFEHAIRKPHGMIILTGPTGSGKATTLYAALATIASPGINIMTVENVVKYQLPRVNQVLVNQTAGFTFAACLRLVRRQDADVVLVSELCDAETARFTIEAANGALLFSTLHTNDAPSAVTRFLDMGIPPFLVASSLVMVVGQRLCRRLCVSCRARIDLPKPALLDAGFTPEEVESVPVYAAPGCANCANTGYVGRTAIFEIMSVTAELQEAILKQEPTRELKECAVKQGMRTLRRAGLRKVSRGITSLDEVLKVTPGD